MYPDKSGLPPYSAVGEPAPPISPSARLWALRGRRRLRRSRTLRVFALVCLAFIVYAQWRQIPSRSARSKATTRAHLSVSKLQDDWALCSQLRRKPQDPVGHGRDRNARWVPGHKPTLIRNATVWTGEPAAGTSTDDARRGKGYSWITSDVLLEYGLIARVEANISTASLPDDVLIYDARGRQLTSGIIDMHSHAGVDSLPLLEGNEDTNEMSEDVTPWARSIDGIQPLDGQIQVIKSGGVTTSLILPGSGNNIGGEAFVIKHAVGPGDGRPELSATDMLADPDRNWRYMKMACGENAKRIFGKIGERGPVSRMGESWEFRKAFETAARLVREQDDWCAEADDVGAANMAGYLPQELRWEALAAVLRGQVHVNTHCYTVPDLEAFVDHTNEFQFSIRAFHHAHQSYLVPEILKRAWGGAPASALFADNMYYKAEAYIGSEYAGKALWEKGLTPIYVSDNPVLNAQHVLFEAAKGYHYGLPYHAALAAVTTAPAERLGLGQRIGKIKPGFDADVVVWDSDPLSVGATPVQVWIDGTAQFEDPAELEKPLGAPIVPDESLWEEPGDPLPTEDAVFTGISHVWLPGYEDKVAGGDRVNVAVSGGKVTCVGACRPQLDAASANGGRVVALKNGYLSPAFTAFASHLGLMEIDHEQDTVDGRRTTVFSRGFDGLALDTKKLRVAHRYGVTRAITAPSLYGTSVGFLTGAALKTDRDAVFAKDVAAHYVLSLEAKRDSKTPSISSAVGALRHALLEAIASNETIFDPYSEKAFLKQVVAGELPLVLEVQSADTIAAVLELKSTIDDTIKGQTHHEGASPQVRIVLVGGAESHLLARELAAAGVGVVLAPLYSYKKDWDQRRALTGAPLTNHTTVDVLTDAGVVTAIGLDEDWLIRDLALLAGIVHKNSGGRLSEKTALRLLSGNIYEMLGLREPSAEGHFVVYEGNPLEIGSRVKAVGGGLGYVTLLG